MDNGIVGSNPTRVTTMIPDMTPVLVGSRKRRVILISCENLLHNRAKISKFKLTVKCLFTNMCVTICR